MNVIEEEYQFIFKFFKTTNLKEANEQIIKEKIELAKITISDMYNEITKIKKESKIKNFFIKIFSFGKINKNKENKNKILEIIEKINELKKEIDICNSIIKRRQKNPNIQKLVNNVNKNQNNEQTNYYSNTCTIL